MKYFIVEIIEETNGYEFAGDTLLKAPTREEAIARAKRMISAWRVGAGEVTRDDSVLVSLGTVKEIPKEDYEFLLNKGYLHEA